MIKRMRILNRIWFWSNIISIIMLLILHYSVNPEKYYPTLVKKTIYIDRSFSEQEKLYIVEAALEWSRATNHIVDYEIKSLPCEIELDEALIFVKYNSDHPDIIFMDFFGYEILGYYNDKNIPSISLVTDRIDAKDFTNVVLHELGHSLGLEHVEDKEMLMYPTMNNVNNKITKKDLVDFCKLYKCNAENLKGAK